MFWLARDLLLESGGSIKEFDILVLPARWKLGAVRIEPHEYPSAPLAAQSVQRWVSTASPRLRATFAHGKLASIQLQQRRSAVNTRPQRSPLSGRAFDADTMRENADEAAQLLKVLANGQRLRVLCLLVDEELSVGEINERIDLSQSALSQHLAKLREEGLVTTRREAQTIYYQLTSGPTKRIISELHDIYCDIESGSRARKRSSNRG